MILPLELAIRSLLHLSPPVTSPTPDGPVDHMLQVAFVPWPGLTADPFLAPGPRQSWLPFRFPAIWSGIVLLMWTVLSPGPNPRRPDRHHISFLVIRVKNAAICLLLWTVFLSMALISGPLKTFAMCYASASSWGLSSTI